MTAATKPPRSLPVKFALLGVALLLAAGCAASPTVVLSGRGEARVTAHLDPVTYLVGWTQSAQDFGAYCQNQNEMTDHLVIAVSPVDIGSSDQPTGEKSFTSTGGNYACHISATVAGMANAWKITFTPTPPQVGMER
jgi:hypothetical protein